MDIERATYDFNGLGGGYVLKFISSTLVLIFSLVWEEVPFIIFSGGSLFLYILGFLISIKNPFLSPCGGYIALIIHLVNVTLFNLIQFGGLCLLILLPTPTPIFPMMMLDLIIGFLLFTVTIGYYIMVVKLWWTRDIFLYSVQEGEENGCSICLINFENQDTLQRLPCKHYFHQICIQKWFETSNTCPLCRDISSLP